MLVLMFPPLLRAGVSVYPTQVFFSHPDRSAALTLNNQTDQAMEVALSFRFGYPVAFDSGNVQFFWSDSADRQRGSAVGWMRAYPERLLLEAGEIQNIRVIATAPPAIQDGEYWARLVISSKPSNPSANRKRTRGISPVLVAETVVPVHYRRGTVTSGVVLRDLGAIHDGKQIRFRFALDRTGNGAFWGSSRLDLVNEAGKVVETRRSPLVVYESLSYADFLNTEGLPAGSYRFSVTVDNKHPQVNADIRLRSTPVTESLRIAIP